MVRTFTVSNSLSYSWKPLGLNAAQTFGTWSESILMVRGQRSRCLWSCIIPVSLFNISDPTVSRYHVQWMPEYCSHNETRGPEKSVTQVSPWQPNLSAEGPISERSARSQLHQQLRAMQSTCLTFCLMLRKDSSAKKTTPLNEPKPICTEQITGCLMIMYDSAMWSGMWWAGQ